MIYFTTLTLDVNPDEGGRSREFAFLNFLDKKNINIKKLSRNSLSRIKNIFYYPIYLLFKKEQILFFHLSSIIILFPPLIFRYNIPRIILKKLFEFYSDKNRVLIEINDLPYEQAKDLELKFNETYKKYFDVILSLNKCEYIYASKEMKKYCAKKYDINEDRQYICINGGPRGESNIIAKGSDKIRFIYAGTLNQGRQIKDIINLFSHIKRDDIELVVCGVGGEWMKNNSYPNILYMGNLPEDKAHELVRSCDIGIIPYDESRFYYNLCYPTKNSFYVTAGIPFLCTNLKETKEWFQEYDCMYFEKFINWSNLIDNITMEDIKNKTKIVNNIKLYYEWDYLINKLFEQLAISF